MVTIDAVKEAGIAELVQLKTRCLPKEGAANETALRRRAKTFPESFLVMKKDSVITGMIDGCASNQQVICDVMHEDESLYGPYGTYQTVFDLDAYPAHQHQGYTGELMQALIEATKKGGKTGMVLICKEHLVGFYERLGYRNMGVSTSVHGGTE